MACIRRTILLWAAISICSGLAEGLAASDRDDITQPHRSKKTTPGAYTHPVRKPARPTPHNSNKTRGRRNLVSREPLNATPRVPGAHVRAVARGLHGGSAGTTPPAPARDRSPGKARAREPDQPDGAAAAPTRPKQTTTVQVYAGPFGAPRIENPSEISLSAKDAGNLAGPLPDDPLRSVQALPGVTSDDDFSSRISLRGADYTRIGLYLDGVLLRQPYFMVQDEGAPPTVTVINNNVLDNIDLQAGVLPTQYADSTAGAIDLQTRESNRTKPSFTLSAGAANANVLGEGPLGSIRTGNWLFSVRKSYMQYIIDRTSPDLAPYAFGMFDDQGKVTFNLGNRNKASLSFTDGYSGLNRDKDLSSLNGQVLTKSYYHYTLANLGWNYTPNAHFLFTNHVAWMREKTWDENKDGFAFYRGQYGEWVWNSDDTWMDRGHTFNFGWTMRLIRDDGLSRPFQYNSFPPGATVVTGQPVDNDYRGTSLRMGGYGNQIWQAARGHVILTTGIRWDRYGVDNVQTVLPQVTLALVPLQSTRLSLGFGQYAQGPDPDWAFSALGGRRLLPERADSFVAAVEQRFDQRTRLRIELYDRQDRDLLFRSWFEPRLIAGQVFIPPLNPPIDNALNGYARGLQVFLQRSGGRRLTGWVSYSLGFSRLHDRQASIAFPADEDQRHTVSVCLSYHLRSTVSLGVRSMYGSGMPVPGFFRVQAGTYYLSAMRNAVYDHPYQRTDFRMDKRWTFDRWKLTFYAEVVNVLDQANQRFENLNGFGPVTGQASLQFMSMLPILPEAGLTFEF